MDGQSTAICFLPDKRIELRPLNNSRIWVLFKPGLVELPVTIGSFELLVVSGVVERQLALVVSCRRVCTP